MTKQSRAGPISMDPAGHENAYRRRSVHHLRKLVESYAKISSLERDRQAEALDRLHLELSKLVRPYGEQHVPVPKEVSVLDWRTRCISPAEIDFTPTQLHQIAGVLRDFGAADSSFVRLLEEMTEDA